MLTFAAGGHAGRGHSLMLWGAASPCPSLHLLIVPPFSFKHVPGGLIYSYSLSYGARKKIGGSAQVPGGLGARNFNYHLCAPLGRGGAEGIDTNRQAQMPSDTGNKAKQNGDRTELQCYFREVAAWLHRMCRPECSWVCPTPLSTRVPTVFEVQLPRASAMKLGTLPGGGGGGAHASL